MLNKSIGLDAAVGRLSCDTSRLLFTWMISHLDKNGCFFGDAEMVKNLVFPRRRDITTRKVSAFLGEMVSEGLITFYDRDGERYIFFPGFARNQPGLRPEREGDSGIPPYVFESDDEGDEDGPGPGPTPEPLRQGSRYSPAQR
jgi:hypothetical protein